MGSIEAGLAIGGTLSMDDVALGATFGHVDQVQDFNFATAGTTVELSF